MAVVIHRYTEIRSIFEVVDDNGVIIDTDEPVLKLTTLDDEDFITAAKGLRESYETLKKENTPTDNAIVQGQNNIIKSLRVIAGQLEMFSKNVDSRIAKIESKLVDVDFAKSVVNDPPSNVLLVSKSQDKDVEPEKSKELELPESVSSTFLKEAVKPKPKMTKTREMARKMRMLREEKNK